jgi:tRNA (Thr-GGU) A37 N-methylase
MAEYPSRERHERYRPHTRLPADRLRSVALPIFAFHRSEGWTARVRPPRGGGKRGVLATRSPHRPNAIGLSAVALTGVDAHSLRVRGMDLLDGTPILDIKPYVPYADAFPDARAGWIDDIDASQGARSAPGPRRPRNTPPMDPNES